METLEDSLKCRICGKIPGEPIDIYNSSTNYKDIMNTILPIWVHNSDVLPKKLCPPCCLKLEHFYAFYQLCTKTDEDFKSQLSWMKTSPKKETITMVKMVPFKVKATSHENNDPENSSKKVNRIKLDQLVFPVSTTQDSHKISPIVSCSRCRCTCTPSQVSKLTKNNSKENHCITIPTNKTKQYDSNSKINNSTNSSTSENSGVSLRPRKTRSPDVKISKNKKSFNLKSRLKNNRSILSNSSLVKSVDKVKTKLSPSADTICVRLDNCDYLVNSYKQNLTKTSESIENSCESTRSLDKSKLCSQLKETSSKVVNKSDNLKLRSSKFSSNLKEDDEVIVICDTYSRKEKDADQCKRRKIPKPSNAKSLTGLKFVCEACDKSFVKEELLKLHKLHE
ncbi:uncharacterized protein LOC106649731, partial [Trichogramma pretiosum]|uniref:uncharacterized protein LOC106649731 n=1 Tax=Trichogramma pretiosum TaxID=7493 RepID=UPI000C71B11A